MRKIIETIYINYESRELLEELLNVRKLPRFIIIETVEEEE